MVAATATLIWRNMGQGLAGININSRDRGFISYGFTLDKRNNKQYGEK